MKTKIIEVTDSGRTNWGKFLVGVFDDEWQRRSRWAAWAARRGEEWHTLDRGLLEREEPGAEYPLLLRRLGWSDRHFFVMDLECGVGGIFARGGNAAVDVMEVLGGSVTRLSPLFISTLEWLYEHLARLSIVDLPDEITVKSM